MRENFFKARRTSLKLTQRQVANSVGKTPQAVSQWESEIASPRICDAETLARVLRASVKEIRNEIGELASRIAKRNGKAVA